MCTSSGRYDLASRSIVLLLVTILKLSICQPLNQSPTKFTVSIWIQTTLQALGHGQRRVQRRAQRRAQKNLPTMPGTTYVCSAMPFLCASSLTFTPVFQTITLEPTTIQSQAVEAIEIYQCHIGSPWTVYRIPQHGDNKEEELSSETNKQNTPLSETGATSGTYKGQSIMRVIDNKQERIV
jgi:hypothetical protein